MRTQLPLTFGRNGYSGLLFAFFFLFSLSVSAQKDKFYEFRTKPNSISVDWESGETWDCFDEKNLTSCNRDDEKAWGEIWHTKFDKKTALFPVMKDHLKAQQQQNVKVLLEFVKQANKWVK